ncbi:MAG: CCA tRNA nucleotidyltransferase [Chlamydiales bacterium]|nr:CCA tRNA nucleotidyltransferase [Chlamydiales bacterium]
MQEHPQARFIVDTLRKEGFVAYYAGGWVRDFLLQRESDDIDIATNAPPEAIQSLFPHTVPIGLAFGIILVIVEGHQYEVATFRQDFDYQDGRRPASIAFSTAEEDAKRRDFTINGMFYDPIEQKVLDFVGGQVDLQAKILRAIGNPHERIKEDRLRMIRAARLACRLHFTIDPATQEAICAHAKELFPAVAVERIWQELSKGLLFDNLVPMLLMLHDFGLLETIFPSLQGVKKEEILKRLEPVKNFPKEAPLISHLLELFPKSSLEEALELCQSLKLSRQDMQFVGFLFHMKQSVNAPKEQVEPITWAYIYANPLHPICLQILAAHQKEKEAFLQLHAEQKKSLEQATERIQKATPLVTSRDLMELGVEPGKKMGLLLKEAERLSINENIQNKEQILRRLQI